MRALKNYTNIIRSHVKKVKIKLKDKKYPV